MHEYTVTDSPLGDLQKLLQYIDEEQFAAFRRSQISALRNERSQGKGPPYVRVGRKIYYPLAGVKAFLEARTVKPNPTLRSPNNGRRCLARAQQ